MGINGRRLKALREQRGLYLQDVADFLGVTRQAYMKYENGETKNPRKLEQLANFFNVTTDYLLGNDSNRIDTPAPAYYLDPETAEMAEELHKRKDMRMLFHAAKSSTPEDVKMVTDMLERFKNS